jgi:hypothetical protein
LTVETYTVRRDADPVVRGEVEHGVGVGHPAGEAFARGQVALDELGVEPVGARVRAGEDDDVVTARAQPPDEAPSDEPRPAGHERAHAETLLAVVSPVGGARAPSGSVAQTSRRVGDGFVP